MAEHEVLHTWHVPRTWHNIDMLGMEVLHWSGEVIVSVLSGRSSICSFFVLCLSFKNSCLSMCIELHLWTDLQFFKWVLFKLVFFLLQQLSEDPLNEKSRSYKCSANNIFKTNFEKIMMFSALLLLVVNATKNRFPQISLQISFLAVKKVFFPHPAFLCLEKSR